MKNFVLKFGRSMLDAIVFLIIIGLIIFTLFCIVYGKSPYGIIILISGLVTITAVCFLLYLLIDIDDNTKSIKELLENYLDELSSITPKSNKKENSAKKIKSSTDDQMVTCQKNEKELKVTGKLLYKP